MFAPKLPKSQTKAAEPSTDRLAPQRSTLMGHRFGQNPVEQARFLQRTIGNQTTFRLFAKRTFSLTENRPSGDHEHKADPATEWATRGVSWDFSKIPLFPPDRPAQAQARPLLRALPMPAVLQPKLTIGDIHDPLELEADRVADRVMRMPDSKLSIPPVPAQLSRKCTAREDEERRQLQTKPIGAPVPAVPGVVHEVLREPGKPLDAVSRAFFEPRFRRDFAGVRIHDDARAGRSAREVGALAYAAGHHVVVDSARHRRGTAEERWLLAHELAHVVQANGGSAQTIHRSSGPGKSGGKPDPSLPNCTAVMGGRTVDYWLAKLAGAQHTFMNFKLDSSNYWLVEGGPLDSDPKKSGAWVKAGDWDTRGPRMTKTFAMDSCPAIKDRMLDATARYHAAGVHYDPTDGPNSNSFMEQLTFTCKDLPRSFTDSDVAWDYWDKPRAGKIHTRPI